MSAAVNPVAEAIAAVGGVRKACAMLGVSTQAMYSTRTRGWLPNTTVDQRRRAEQLAKASGVPLAQLVTPPPLKRRRRRATTVAAS